MRLRDLDAEFWGQASAGGYTRQGDQLEGAQGILFQCPSCAKGKESGEENGRRFFRGVHSLRIPFSNPRGARPAPKDYGVARWRIVSGSGLDDLTLSPSINADIPWRDGDGVEHPSVCKFHGYVRNGGAE